MSGHDDVLHAELINKNQMFKVDSEPLQIPKLKPGVEPKTADLKTRELASQRQLAQFYNDCTKFRHSISLQY